MRAALTHRERRNGKKGLYMYFKPEHFSSKNYQPLKDWLKIYQHLTPLYAFPYTHI